MNNFGWLLLICCVLGCAKRAGALLKNVGGYLAALASRLAIA